MDDNAAVNGDVAVRKSDTDVVAGKEARTLVLRIAFSKRHLDRGVHIVAAPRLALGTDSGDTIPGLHKARQLTFTDGSPNTVLAVEPHLAFVIGRLSAVRHRQMPEQGRSDLGVASPGKLTRAVNSSRLLPLFALVGRRGLFGVLSRLGDFARAAHDGGLELLPVDAGNQRLSLDLSLNLAFIVQVQRA